MVGTYVFFECCGSCLPFPQSELETPLLVARPPQAFIPVLPSLLLPARADLLLEVLLQAHIFRFLPRRRSVRVGLLLSWKCDDNVWAVQHQLVDIAYCQDYEISQRIGGI